MPHMPALSEYCSTLTLTHSFPVPHTTSTTRLSSCHPHNHHLTAAIRSPFYPSPRAACSAHYTWRCQFFTRRDTSRTSITTTVLCLPNTPSSQFSLCQRMHSYIFQNFCIYTCCHGDDDEAAAGCGATSTSPSSHSGLGLMYGSLCTGLALL